MELIADEGYGMKVQSFIRQSVFKIQAEQSRGCGQKLQIPPQGDMVKVHNTVGNGGIDNGRPVCN